MLSVPEKDKEVLLIPSTKHKSEARVRDMASLGNMYWDAAGRGRVHQAPLHSHSVRTYQWLSGHHLFTSRRRAWLQRKTETKLRSQCHPMDSRKTKVCCFQALHPNLSLFFMGCCMTKFARKCRDCGFAVMAPHNQGLPRRTLGSDVSKQMGP